MGARDLATAKPVPKKHTPYKRMGPATKSDKEVVADLLKATPGEVNVRALAKVLRRSTEVTRRLVEEARQNFAETADEYRQLHLTGVRDAISTGDPKGLDAGIRGAQWALENIAFEGQRIVEKAPKEAAGTKVMIGVKLELGGKVDPAALPPAVITAETVETDHA